MRKRISWLLYVTVVAVIGFFSWQAIQKQHDDPTMDKFKRDLSISPLSKQAPSFTLTDQYGKVISLSDFTNKKIVIQPIDPECKDICPLISQEIIDANNQLGSLSKNVVYIGLNVNEYHNKVKDVRTFSDQHGLSALKNWYFLTGSSDVLKKVWKDYGVMVVPKKEGDVIHTSAIIFVDRSGKEVYLGTPQDDGSTLIEWSNAISYILKKIS